MPPGPHRDFRKNVFINCPFDSEYNSLLRPILFTIVYFGFIPQTGFIDTVHLKKADSATAIWYKFMNFNDDFYERRKSEGFLKDDLKMMPVREYIAFIQAWIKNNR